MRLYLYITLLTLTSVLQICIKVCNCADLTLICSPDVTRDDATFQPVPLLGLLSRSRRRPSNLLRADTEAASEVGRPRLRLHSDGLPHHNLARISRRVLRRRFKVCIMCVLLSRLKRRNL